MGWSSLRAVPKDEVFRLEGFLGQNTEQGDFSDILLLGPSLLSISEYGREHKRPARYVTAADILIFEKKTSKL